MHILPGLRQSIKRAVRCGEYLPYLATTHVATDGSARSHRERNGSVGTKIDHNLSGPDKRMDVAGLVILRIELEPSPANPHGTI